MFSLALWPKGGNHEPRAVSLDPHNEALNLKDDIKFQMLFSTFQL